MQNSHLVEAGVERIVNTVKRRITFNYNFFKVKWLV